MYKCKCCVSCGRAIKSNVPYCTPCDEDMEYIESLFDPNELELVGKELIHLTFISPGCTLEAMRFEQPNGKHHSFYK